MAIAAHPLPAPRKLARRLGRRLRGLLQRQEKLLALCRREGEPEQIHELRAVTRRLRVLLGLAAPLLGRKRTAAAIADTRRISRATDRLRDLDVSLEFVGQAPAHPAAIQALQRQRRRLWLHRRGELTAPSAATLAARGWGRLARHPAKLARSYAKELERHRLELLALLPGLHALPLARQHAFRRALRRLRYLCELRLPRRRLPRDLLCRVLIRAQEALGGRLDAAVCQASLATLKLPSLTPEPAASHVAAQRLSRFLRKLQAVLRVWGIARPPANRP